MKELLCEGHAYEHTDEKWDLRKPKRNDLIKEKYSYNCRSDGIYKTVTSLKFCLYKGNKFRRTKRT